VKKLEQSRDEFINHHQHQPELLFKKMYQSIGTFFKAFHIRKLYNTNPSLSLEEYCKLPLFQQAMNNVIDKKKKLLPSSLHKGGNCVYWSMFFLHFIESWRIPGLEVKLFTSTKGHTFLRMKFKERYYKLNVYGTKGNKETLFPSPYPHLYEVAATPELAHFFSFSGTNQQQIMKFQKECQLRNEIWLEYNGMEHNKVGVSISAGRIEIFEEEGSCVLQLAEFSPCEM
jgi:hypothetical protein